MSQNPISIAINALNQGQFSAAIQNCEKILRHEPGNATAMLVLAHATHQLGRTEDAIKTLRALLARQPHHLDGLNNLGILLEHSGQFDEAITHYETAIRHHPNEVSPLSNLGDLLRKVGRTEEAISLLKKAYAAAPQRVPLINQLALAYQQSGDIGKAHTLLEQALSLDPKHAGTNTNLGTLLYIDKDYEQAVPFLQKGLEGNPNNFAALNNLAACLIDLLRLDEARQILERTQKIAPDAPELLDNLGKWYMFKGQMTESLECFDRAHQLQPENWRPVWHRSFTHLLLGNFAQGWDDYHAGYVSGERIIRSFPFPLWEGQDVSQSTILVHAEQGLGDEIMFASCIPQLLLHCRKVILECDKRLASLFSLAFPEAEIVSGSRTETQSQLVKRDDIHFQIPGGSLPRFFRRNRGDFPGTAFLRPNSEHVEKWRSRFAKLGKKRIIGISWRAGSKDDQLKRSMTLEKWRPILESSEIAFVNLQYGHTNDDIECFQQTSDITIHHWPDSDPLHEQQDFAAQIAALDGIISVSNATVHLAGALGVKTMNLLPYVPSWRWTFRGSDTPWYRSVRLIRQSKQDDWDSVVKQVMEQLPIFF